MRLGIVGISGLVGEKILQSLYILNIKYEILRVFASASSVGNKIKFRDSELNCEYFNLEYMREFDYIILAVENDIARTIIEYKIANNIPVTIIDNSSEYRLDPEVPLIIPEININDMKCKQIIANPNCSTTMLCMLLAPLLHLSEIKKVNVSTYQAASGAGKKGLDELMLQTSEIISGKDLTKDFWKKQYVFNVFSHNSKITDNFYNQEEMKMISETKKILKKSFVINPTCVRVPTLTSHCLSVNVEFADTVDIHLIYEVLDKFPGIIIYEDSKTNSYPEPILTSNKTDVYVGRIRPELSSYENSNHMGFNYKSYNFFVSGDQLLKGAAYNSVQILKHLLDK
jgi:aspartate-semialdehyde dehydrogenase